MNSGAVRPRGASSLGATLPPEALFVVSAAAQYSGAVVAIGLFDQLAPATVAWLRVLFAAVILIALSRRLALSTWSRHDLVLTAAFGTATAAMNMLFFLAVDRLPLGKGVTIEFIGPIAVAALQTRTRRNAVALSLATLGVVVLGGVELGSDPLGLVYILGASAMWAGYIVAGSRVALADRGLAGLGVGMLIGAAVVAPFGLADAATAFGSPTLLAACAAVGLLSNVVGYGIDQSTLRRVPVRRFSVLLALLPVCAAVFGFVFLAQQPTVLDLAGMALVLAGVVSQERDEIVRHHREASTT